MRFQCQMHRMQTNIFADVKGVGRCCFAVCLGGTDLIHCPFFAISYSGQQGLSGFRKLVIVGKLYASVTHRAPERMRESSYPTLAHKPPEKSDATPPSSPNVGTIGHQLSPGKLRPLT